MRWLCPACRAVERGSACSTPRRICPEFPAFPKAINKKGTADFPTERNARRFQTKQGGFLPCLSLTRKSAIFPSCPITRVLFEKVTKADVLGKWSLFFFYPADFTFVCPTELEDLQNRYADFCAAGCEIYAVSTDSHFVHKAWHDASERIGKLTYHMLADPTHALCRDFDVRLRRTAWRSVAASFVNPEGKIVVYEVNAGNIGRNADELFRAACRQASLSLPTGMRSVPPSGSPAPKR